MIDHVGALVLVMLIRLRDAFGIFGMGQQGVSSWLLRACTLQVATLVSDGIARNSS